MPDFRYHGVVFPRWRPLSVEYEPELQVSRSDIPDARILCSMREGEVTVSVAVDAYTEDTWHALFQPVLDAAQSLANTVGFIAAVPYTVVLEAVVTPDGKTRSIALGDPVLRNLTSFTTDDVEAISDELLEDHALSLLVSDLLMSLNKTHYAAIAYGRVADGLARIVSPGVAMPQAWRTLRQTLRVDEAYLRLLTSTAVPQRHGDRVPVSAKLNRELSIRAWTLVDRYLVLRIRGSLNEDDYPQLVGR